MVILVPRAFRLKFMLNGFDRWSSDRDECVLKYIYDLGEFTNKSSALDREDLKNLCETVISESTRNSSSGLLSGFSQKVYFLVFDTILDMDNKVLLERVLPMCFASTDYQPTLVRIREKYGYQWLLARCVCHQ